MLFLVTIVLALLPDVAPGYRFLVSSSKGTGTLRIGNWSAIPTADTAVRWDPSVWGPGDTLKFVVTNDPGWTSSWTDSSGQTRPAPFENMAEVVRVVSEALSAWAAIETADIRWEITEVADLSGFSCESFDSRFIDGHSTIRVYTDDSGCGAGNGASLLARRSDPGSPFLETECDIFFGAAGAAHIANGGDNLIHELGHCLGFAHSGARGFFAALHDPAVDGLVEAWGPTPTMSYGIDLTSELTLDDITGASLLRPAPGWLRSTGAVSGRVTAGGVPARYVPVLVAKMSPSGLGSGVGAFTNETGRFLIEGLVPGDYLIRAASMLQLRAHMFLVEDGATLDLRDRFVLDPVVVRAGSETDGIELELKPGRLGHDRIQQWPFGNAAPGSFSWSLPHGSCYPPATAKAGLMTTDTGHGSDALTAEPLGFYLSP